jgi:hypothetical protein
MKRRRKARKNTKYGGFWPFDTKPPVREVSNDVQAELQKTSDNAYMGTTATAVTSGVITTLAASGVGIPVAALLAGALLIATKMFDLVRTNLMLRLLMKDAILIIMDCYLLFDLINKSYAVIGLYDDPYNDCTLDDQKIIAKIMPKPMDDNQLLQLISRAKPFMDKIGGGVRYQINKNMQQQLTYQLTKLLNVLIHLMETDVLNKMMQDATLGNAFGDMLKDEYDKRQKEAGVIGYFSTSKIARNYDRKFGGTYYINEINNILTIINSYITLLKSNLDTVFKKFEILTPEVYKIMWTAILCSKEYNSYIKPELEEAVNHAKEEVKETNSNNLREAVRTVNEVDMQNPKVTV